MAATLPKNYITVEEYLAAEEISEIKHEYYDGEIFAMAGGSEQHDLLAGNTFANLHSQLRGRQCNVHTSDMMVKTQQVKPIYSYPDITVVCGKTKFENEKRRIVLNPSLIVEVLSPSTEGYDRGAKFESYRSIPSFQEYILIAQDRIYIEHHIRQPDGSWNFTEHHNLTDEITLPTIDCSLSLSDIYESVELQPFT